MCSWLLTLSLGLADGPDEALVTLIANNEENVFLGLGLSDVLTQALSVTMMLKF